MEKIGNLFSSSVNASVAQGINEQELNDATRTSREIIRKAGMSDNSSRLLGELDFPHVVFNEHIKNVALPDTLDMLIYLYQGESRHQVFSPTVSEFIVSFEMEKRAYKMRHGHDDPNCLHFNNHMKNLLLDKLPAAHAAQLRKVLLAKTHVDHAVILKESPNVSPYEDVRKAMLECLRQQQRQVQEDASAWTQLAMNDPQSVVPKTSPSELLEQEKRMNQAVLDFHAKFNYGKLRAANNNQLWMRGSGAWLICLNIIKDFAEKGRMFTDDCLRQITDFQKKGKSYEPGRWLAPNIDFNSIQDVYRYLFSDDVLYKFFERDPQSSQVLDKFYQDANDIKHALERYFEQAANAASASGPLNASPAAHKHELMRLTAAAIREIKNAPLLTKLKAHRFTFDKNYWPGDDKITEQFANHAEKAKDAYIKNVGGDRPEEARIAFNNFIQSEVSKLLPDALREQFDEILSQAKDYDARRDALQQWNDRARHEAVNPGKQHFQQHQLLQHFR